VESASYVITRAQLADVIWKHGDDITAWRRSDRSAAVATILGAADDYAAGLVAAERERLQAGMPPVTVQVADGGTISEAGWQALGERLKAAWQEIQESER
jgi:hypothetical protein